MIGVIVLSGPFPGMHGLDAQRSPALLPLGDRPAIQHIIESLVTQGITTIELIVGHAPEQVEKQLGNGDRWGCQFRYHLAAQPERPYRSLKVIPSLATQPWVLIHAERYPCVDFSNQEHETVLYYVALTPAGDASVITSNSEQHNWGGTVIMPPTMITETFANYTPAELHQYLNQKASTGLANTIIIEDWLDVSSPANLLESQAKLLDKKLYGLLMSGTEQRPGVWISRNVTVHPAAQLIPPLYVGPNSRISRGVKLGPYAVVGADCIVDSNTSIENALVLEGSYIGEALEVHKAVVAHNLLVNVRLDASIDISEDFLLGRLSRRKSRSWTKCALQSIAASFLALLFLPLAILSILYFILVHRTFYTFIDMFKIPIEDRPSPQANYALLGLGSDAWSVHRSAGWQSLFRQFLPGLLAVICGRINLVGLPPRTSQQIEALSEDWREIHIAGKAGLITEASIAASDHADEMQLYLADAYYSVQRSWLHDLSLVAKYFARLVISNRKPEGSFVAETSKCQSESKL